MSARPFAPILFGLLLPAGSLVHGQVNLCFQHCHDKAPPGSVACEAVDEATATPPDSGPPSMGLFGGNDTPIQYVRVGPPESQQRKIYMAYSTLVEPGHLEPIRNDNAVITVLELSCNESADVLVFGTGYGCRTIPLPGTTGWAEFGPEVDAQNVDSIIRGCLRLQGSVKVSFFAPHGHPDHINPEFIHKLLELDNYTLGKIYIQSSDYPALDLISGSSGHNCTGSINEFGDLMDKVEPFGQASDTCEEIVDSCEPNAFQSPLSFCTTVGKVWFRTRPGHTLGSVDMVIDYLGSASQRYVIYGSAAPCCYAAINWCAPCTTACLLNGVQWAIPAHGNIKKLCHVDECDLDDPCATCTGELCDYD